MGAIISGSFMTTKSKELLANLDTELKRNQENTQTMLSEIKDAAGVENALTSLKEAYNWLDKGIPANLIRALEQLCDSASSACCCCDSIVKAIKVEAEQIINTGQTALSQARDALSQPIQYLQGVVDLLGWNTKLQAALDASGKTFDANATIDVDTGKSLVSNPQWIERKSHIELIAGTPAYSNVADRDAAAAMQKAGLPVNANIATLVDSELNGAALRLLAMN